MIFPLVVPEFALVVNPVLPNKVISPVAKVVVKLIPIPKLISPPKTVIGPAVVVLEVKDTFAVFVGLPIVKPPILLEIVKPGIG